MIGTTKFSLIFTSLVILHDKSYVSLHLNFTKSPSWCGAYFSLYVYLGESLTNSVSIIVSYLDISYVSDPSSMIIPWTSTFKFFST